MSLVPLALESSSSAFSPRFLELARRLPILRFSGWQKEWGGPAPSPARGAWLGGRALPTSQTQAGPDGVALELIVALALEARARTAWISVPWTAGPDYLAGQANLMLRGLGLGAESVLRVSPSAAGAPLTLGAGGAPAFTGVLMVESSAGLQVVPSAGSRMMNVTDAWEAAIAALANDCAALAVASGASAADASVPFFYGSIRARVRFVVTLASDAYFPTTVTSFAQAMNARAPQAASLGAGSLAPQQPPKPLSTVIGPELWSYAFFRVDAFARQADTTSSNALASSLRFADPSLNITASGVLGWSDAEVFAALRSNVLLTEVADNRFAAQSVSLTFSPNASVPQLGVSRKFLYISAGGWALTTPDFGAISAAASAANNATLSALLAPAAALETSLFRRLASIAQSPALTGLWLDHLRRLDASCYDGFVGTDIMRPIGPALAWGLLNRASGATALSLGWPAPKLSNNATPSNTVDALVAASPALLAFALFANTSLPPPETIPAYPLVANSAAPSPSPPPTAQGCAPGACRWGTCWAGSCLCFPGVAGAACDIGGLAPGAAPPRIGLNVAGVSYWSTERLYVDIARAGSAWISQAGWQDYSFMGWSYGSVPPCSPRGYPLALAPGLSVGTMHLRDLQGHYEPGTYVIRYAGDAVLDAWMSDVQAVRRIDVGRMEVDLTPTTGLNNGLFLRLERSSPTAPFRDLTILPAHVDPAYAAAFPFSPAALAFFSNFSTLRFMDLASTNDQQDNDTDFLGAGYPQPGDRSYAIAGIPVLDQILLANSAGTHAWINVPHAWSDDAVRALAAAWYSGLQPGLSLTIEYSNEVWGTLFMGGQYAQRNGLAMGLGAGDPAQARFCYYGMRSREIFRIFAAAAPATEAAAWRARLRFVLSAQFVNPDTSKRILACNNSFEGVDALAVAPYLSPPLTAGNTGRDANLLTVDGVLNETTGSIWPALSSLFSTTLAQAAVAAAYNVSLVFYEAGQGLTGDSSYLQQALAIAVNRDKRMAAVYVNYTSSLLSGAAGNASLLMHYSSVGLPSRYGSWGLKEATDSNPAMMPKVRGLLAVVDASRKSPARGKARLSGQQPCPTSAVGAICSDAGECIDAPYPGGPNSSCACFTGASGAACEVNTYVDISTCSYKCSFHGACIMTHISGFNRYWACACDSGYSGDACLAFTCPSNCKFQGRCVDANVCQCYDGYTGADCSSDCGCGSHGVCTSSAGGYTNVTSIASLPPSCACDVGYEFLRSGGTTSIAGRSGSYAAGSCMPVCDDSCAAGNCVRPGVCSCSPSCLHGECLGGTCLCWAGWIGASCSVPMRDDVAAATGGLAYRLSPAGMNLAGISDWSSEIPFLDLARTARPWFSQYVPAYAPQGVYIWDLGVAVPQNLTREGWPAELPLGYAVGTLMARDVSQRLPSGQYIVRYKGSGWLTFGFDAQIVSERKGRIVLNVVLAPPGVRDNGIYMQVISTDPRDPIREIRVLLPGAEGLSDDGLEFNPAFLAQWSSLSSFRFMDWTNTGAPDDGTWHVPSDWSRRTTRESFSYHARSVPLETMVHLCNILGVSPWFNIHHQSPPQWIKSAASLVTAQLRGDVRISLEASNEAWSTATPQGKAMAAQAAVEGSTSAQVFAAFSAAMLAAWDAGAAAYAAASGGGAGVTPHARSLILSTFTANSWYTGKLLTARVPCSMFTAHSVSPLCPNATETQAGGGASNATFPAWHAAAALGVSAYMDCGGLGSTPASAAATAATSVSAILSACTQSLPAVASQWSQHTAALQAGGASSLPFAVYEGGVGLVEAAAIASGSETPGLTALLIAANRDQGMEVILRGFLDATKPSLKGSVAPFMFYSSIALPSKYGSWGLFEYMGEPLTLAPKARALFSFISDGIAERARKGCLNPAAINFNATALFSDPSSCIFPVIPLAAEGGTIAFNGTAVSLNVPTGAINKTTSFSLAEVPPTAVPALSGLLGTGGGGAWAALAPTNETLPPQSLPPTAAALLGARAVATKVYDLGPDGSVFAEPLTVCVTINTTEAAASGWGPSAHALNLSAALGPSTGPDTTRLVLYWSSDGGRNWTSTLASTLVMGEEPNTAILCGNLSHFTYVAGLAVPEGVLVVDVASAVAASLSTTAGGGSGGGSAGGSNSSGGGSSGGSNSSGGGSSGGGSIGGGSSGGGGTTAGGGSSGGGNTTGGGSSGGGGTVGGESSTSTGSSSSSTPPLAIILGSVAGCIAFACIALVLFSCYLHRANPSYGSPYRALLAAGLCCSCCRGGSGKRVGPISSLQPSIASSQADLPHFHEQKKKRFSVGDLHNPKRSTGSPRVGVVVPPHLQDLPDSSNATRALQVSQRSSFAALGIVPAKSASVAWNVDRNPAYIH